MTSKSNDGGFHGCTAALHWFSLALVTMIVVLYIHGTAARPSTTVDIWCIKMFADSRAPRNVGNEICESEPWQ